MYHIYCHNTYIMKTHKTSKLLSLVAVSALILFFSIQSANLRGNRADVAESSIPKVHVRTTLNYWESYEQHYGWKQNRNHATVLPATEGC